MGLPKASVSIGGVVTRIEDTIMYFPVYTDDA